MTQSGSGRALVRNGLPAKAAEGFKMIRMRRSSARLPLWLCFSSLLFAQEPASIEKAMDRFLVALNNLDLSVMGTLYDEHATTFSPSRAERIEDSAVGLAIREQFESIRNRSQKSGPPYLDVKPQQMGIDRISQDVAVVSFHLKNETGVGRRTLVWKRFSDGWKIVHLHASTLNIAP